MEPSLFAVNHGISPRIHRGKSSRPSVSKVHQKSGPLHKSGPPMLTSCWGTSAPSGQKTRKPGASSSELNWILQVGLVNVLQISNGRNRNSFSQTAEIPGEIQSP